MPEHLPPIALKVASVVQGELRSEPGKGRPRLSRESVQVAITKAGGNKVEAAKALGVSRATLYRFLDETDSGAE